MRLLVSMVGDLATMSTQVSETRTRRSIDTILIPTSFLTVDTKHLLSVKRQPRLVLLGISTTSQPCS